jgi:glycosyltransferase involved in cell wall biosynthesis
MRILFLSTWFPFPTTNGSKIRVYGLLRGLAQQHEVTLLSFIDRESRHNESPKLQSLCREVKVIPAQPFDPNKKRISLDYLSPTPKMIRDTFSPEMARCIRETLSLEKYDLVIASQLGTAIYSSSFGDTPALLEEAELGVLYEKYANAASPAAKVRNGLTWIKHRRYVAELLPDFRVCTVVSEQERGLLSQVAPKYQSVEVIPNFINLDEYDHVRVDPRPNQLIFCGPFRYFANHEAMVWFIQEVYPRIQAHVPEVSLVITGDHADLPLPSASNVTLTGFMEDIRSLIASSSVSIVPLLSGGGTRLKILEAMALGVPVVATSKGAEGLDIITDQHLLIADSPRAFADNVVRLLMDPAKGKEITARACQLVAEKYDWAVVIPKFLELATRVRRNSFSI